jgi:GT2 family glycosyltransferase
MDASIIIVNWNTKELLINCLNSVYGTVKTLAFEVLVVDNGSSDGSVEAIKTLFPGVRLIENKKNLGFAKANNQALRQMNGQYAVLLNSDAVLTDGAVETIIRFMDENNKIGICGGQLLNADGSKQNSIANSPTLATELLNKSLLRRLFPRKYPGKEHDFKEPIEVESIVGACMVVRKEAINDVGLLDESYFFFLEETDWCLNMRKRGWKVFHHPDAKIYHLQGQSAGKVNVRARIEYWRSRYTFFKKNYGSVSLNILRLGLILKVFISMFMLSIVYAASLLLSKKVRERLNLYSVLIAWHFKGTPSEWGLTH